MKHMFVRVEKTKPLFWHQSQSPRAPDPLPPASWLSWQQQRSQWRRLEERKLSTSIHVYDRDCDSSLFMEVYQHFRRSINSKSSQDLLKKSLWFAVSSAGTAIPAMSGSPVDRSFARLSAKKMLQVKFILLFVSFSTERLGKSANDVVNFSLTTCALHNSNSERKLHGNCWYTSKSKLLTHQNRDQLGFVTICRMLQKWCKIYTSSMYKPSKKEKQFFQERHSSQTNISPK